MRSCTAENLFVDALLNDYESHSKLIFRINAFEGFLDLRDLV
jgi:hypothetical protein